MPRPPRNLVPDFPAHLTHRGNDRQDIFRRPEDFGVFKHFLKEAVDRHAVAVNAYVLMSNHIHLLLTPREPFAISRALHSASRRYTGYFNARYERTGILWEGRFHASPVTAERYLFACYRYIDMNPVRAGIVTDPKLYAWSSHCFYAAGAKDSLVTPHPAILELSEEPSRRQDRYRALFCTHSDPAELDLIRNACKAGRAVGSNLTSKGRPRKEMVPDTII